MRLEWTPDGPVLPSGWQESPKPVWRDMRAGAGDAPFTDINVATDGTVCGVDQNGAAVRWNGTSWDAMGGGRVTHIAASDRKSFWGIDGNDIVQQYRPPHGDRRSGISPPYWQSLPPLPQYYPPPGDTLQPQPAISITVGSDGIVWAVGAGEHIYQFGSGAWIDTEWGPVAQIAGGDSYNLIGLTQTELDSDTHPIDNVWISNFGPLGVPLHTVPPPAPPVAAFSRWWGVAGMPLSSAPALAAYNRKAYFACKDNDSRGWLWLGTLEKSSDPEYDPGTQTGPGSPGFPLGSPPALAEFNSVLYCAFQARDAGHALCVTRSFDGETFFPVANIPGNEAGSTPALAAFNGRLYCAYQSNDARHILYVTSSADGVTWTAARGYDGIHVGGAPTLAVFKGRLLRVPGRRPKQHVVYHEYRRRRELGVAGARLLPIQRRQPARARGVQEQALLRPSGERREPSALRHHLG